MPMGSQRRYMNNIVPSHGQPSSLPAFQSPPCPPFPRLRMATPKAAPPGMEAYDLPAGGTAYRCVHGAACTKNDAMNFKAAAQHARGAKHQRGGQPATPAPPDPARLDGTGMFADPLSGTYSCGLARPDGGGPCSCAEFTFTNKLTTGLLQHQATEMHKWCATKDDKHKPDEARDTVACGLCRGNHKQTDCPTLTAAEKAGKCNAAGPQNCGKCGEPGHKRWNCPDQRFEASDFPTLGELGIAIVQGRVARAAADRVEEADVGQLPELHDKFTDVRPSLTDDANQAHLWLSTEAYPKLAARHLPMVESSAAWETTLRDPRGVYKAIYLREDGGVPVVNGLDRIMFDSHACAKLNTFAVFRNTCPRQQIATPLHEKLRCIDAAYELLKDFDSREAYREDLVVEYEELVGHAQFAALQPHFHKMVRSTKPRQDLGPAPETMALATPIVGHGCRTYLVDTVVGNDGAVVGGPWAVLQQVHVRGGYRAQPDRFHDT